MLISYATGYTEACKGINIMKIAFKILSFLAYLSLCRPLQALNLILVELILDVFFLHSKNIQIINLDCLQRELSLKLTNLTLSPALLSASTAIACETSTTETSLTDTIISFT